MRFLLRGVGTIEMASTLWRVSYRDAYTQSSIAAGLYTELLKEIL